MAHGTDVCEGQSNVLWKGLNNIATYSSVEQDNEFWLKAHTSTFISEMMADELLNL